MSAKYLCRVCSKLITPTKNLRYRSHTNGEGDSCEMSSEPIPDDLLAQAPSTTEGVPEEGKDFATCPDCTRAVKLTRLGYFENHNTTLNGGERCGKSGTRLKYETTNIPLPGEEVPEKGMYRATHPRVTAQQEMERAPSAPPAERSCGTGQPETTTDAKTPDAGTPQGSPVTPSDETYRRNLIQQPMEVTEELLKPWGSVPEAAGSGVSTETSSPESVTTSNGSPTLSDEPSPTLIGTASEDPFRLGISLSQTISQPDSPFLQPPPYSGPEKPEPMGDLAKELATRIKETFYAYDNRKAADNRSAQTTLGPSEIGTPCDRRLAMALMGIPAVNPGGDGWAAFVGTMGHVGMAEMFRFADAGTGRYAVEMPLKFPSVHVPHGTTDQLDRRDGTVTDWKFMGSYSLKKFKLEGPSDTYRIQGQVYGLGAELAGEKVKNIAIVGLPRGGGSLDDMHVWTEKFDRRVGVAALARVEKIATEVESFEQHGTPMEIARRFDTANDCRYCPFHLKGDKEMNRGCPGA